MGAGIAQLAAQAGAETLLHDPVAEASSAAIASIVARWERGRAGRLDAGDARCVQAAEPSSTR